MSELERLRKEVDSQKSTIKKLNKELSDEREPCCELICERDLDSINSEKVVVDLKDKKTIRDEEI